MKKPLQTSLLEYLFESFCIHVNKLFTQERSSQQMDAAGPVITAKLPNGETRSIASEKFYPGQNATCCVGKVVIHKNQIESG